MLHDATLYCYYYSVEPMCAMNGVLTKYTMKCIHKVKRKLM